MSDAAVLDATTQSAPAPVADAPAASPVPDELAGMDRPVPPPGNSFNRFIEDMKAQALSSLEKASEPPVEAPVVQAVVPPVAEQPPADTPIFDANQPAGAAAIPAHRMKAINEALAAGDLGYAEQLLALAKSGVAATAAANEPPKFTPPPPPVAPNWVEIGTLAEQQAKAEFERDYSYGVREPVYGDPDNPSRITKYNIVREYEPGAEPTSLAAKLFISNRAKEIIAIEQQKHGEVETAYEKKVAADRQAFENQQRQAQARQTAAAFTSSHIKSVLAKPTTTISIQGKPVALNTILPVDAATGNVNPTVIARIERSVATTIRDLVDDLAAGSPIPQDIADMLNAAKLDPRTIDLKTVEHQRLLDLFTAREVRNLIDSFGLTPRAPAAPVAAAPAKVVPIVAAQNNGAPQPTRTDGVVPDTLAGRQAAQGNVGPAAEVPGQSKLREFNAPGATEGMSRNEIAAKMAAIVKEQFQLT